MSEQTATLLKTFVAAIGGFFGYFLGGYDPLLKALILFVVVDYISGMIAAWATKELKSKLGFIGIAKKVMLFLLVAVGEQVDQTLGSNGMFREAIVFSFIGNELLSITENAGKIGIPLPEQLMNAVEVLKGKSKKGDGEQ